MCIADQLAEAGRHRFVGQAKLLKRPHVVHRELGTGGLAKRQLHPLIFRLDGPANGRMSPPQNARGR